MTYFQYTKRDLADARKGLGESLLALAQDTNDKLNADELDRTYVIEDLLARMVAIAHESGANVKLFPVGETFFRHVPAYPIGEGKHNADAEVTQDLTDAIRETWEAQTFNGVPRHEHIGMPGDQCHRSFGGFKCNLYWGHAVHETDFESRSKRDA